jgi:DNA-binding HxlR family transcriptional regulator
LSEDDRERTLGEVKSYGQYCPIARTSELLAERWTPILIRNLLAGCRTFGQLLDGAPGMSRALLAQRLDLLERQGIVTKEPYDSGRVRFVYDLTDKGRELKAVTDAMGHWGARWLEVEPQHLDPTYVLWATGKLVDADLLPASGLVVRVELADRPQQPFWLVLRRPNPEVCTTFLGWVEDLVIHTDSETLARWHLRHTTYRDAVRAERLRIDGNRRAVQAFLGALRASPFAGTQPAP